MASTWNFEPVNPYVPETPRTVDPPECVQMCLNCYDRPDCENCMNGGRRGRKYKINVAMDGG